MGLNTTTLFTLKQKHEIYDEYMRLRDQWIAAGERLSAPMSRIQVYAVCENSPGWVGDSTIAIARRIVENDMEAPQITERAVNVLLTQYDPASWNPKIEQAIDEFIGSSFFDKEDLIEAYQDLQTLGNIYDKMVNNPSYRDAMIHLIWITTGDSDLIHELYSPEEDTKSTLKILFGA